MRAVVHAGNGRVRVDEVADPRLCAPTDAIVRVRRAAVCGTDLHVLAHHEALPRGFVLGHEFAGEVVERGDAVHGHELGDVVLAADYTACGRCWWCRRGDHWQCAERRFFGTGSLFGAPLAGAQAELVRVPFADTTLVGLPDGVDLDAAVLLGDTVATGYAAVRRAGLEPGETVAVLGGGPVGQVTSLVAQACGAGVVVVVEPVAGRREVAAREGALPAAPEDARGVVDGVTDGRGADVVVDAVGGDRGLALALDLVRRRGRVAAVGVPEDTVELPAARAFTEELGVSFAVGDVMRDAEPLLALVRAGTLDPAAVVSDRISLDEVPEAYRSMSERLTLKPLIRL
ncbi:alcohol dehydrogenase catalytic domain-containing protein [Actinomycetospora sp. TBRC 11914]|uniref:alcohol dehydrogenase catalytic domain-containing protein n=1 Tax=Actinomycetospora sp. TBRC 11914 TaxID=2729387 RepID=UPI00145DBFB5|nr:alcohol dehydrogenase catalytic domain-containing protein [Actinomycetospora sp. TBRC 11914]NMO90970.1 alcohol dehydrogenase catalytic domain-containing protein [Actinomycetospora sp. TBRC 11914]